MTAWQPIETGPRDGHRQLVAGSNQGIGWVMIGHYAPYDGCRWLSDDEKPLQGVTHWMPLPPPPVTP